MAGTVSVSVTSSSALVICTQQCQTLYRDHCIFLPAMLGWFFFSSLLSTYNKIVFGDDHMAFPCPLLMTSVHFLIQWVVAWVLSSIPMWAEPLGGTQIQEMSWTTFLKISLPCGIVTALDVGFSNLAIARISVTLYTMLKASSPIFVVASAFLFRLEPITAGLIVVVLIICCGEFLTVYGESQDTFDTVGAIFCLLASVCSGLRWTIVQFLIQSLDPPLKSAIATMRLVSPCMFVFMLACSFAMERPLQTFGGGGAAGGDDGNDNHLFFDNLQHSLTTVGMAAMGGVLAVSMILCELFLIMKSSAIILMVGGVVKELCTICLG
jgi:solute carrier family 35 protein C2